MPKILAPGVEELILLLSKDIKSHTMIMKKLADAEHKVSERTIFNVINRIGDMRKSRDSGTEIQKRKNRRNVRSDALIKKIAKELDKPNPISQNSMAKKYNMCQSMVNLIIHEDLEMHTRIKYKAHRLSDANKKNRKTNCRKFYKKGFAGDRSEFIVTLDEAWVYLNYCNGERRICYAKKRKPPEE
jgi:ribosomal protein S25